MNALKLNEANFDILEAKIKAFLGLPIGVTTDYTDKEADDNGDYWVPIEDHLDIVDSLSEAEKAAQEEYLFVWPS